MFAPDRRIYCFKPKYFLASLRCLLFSGSLLTGFATNAIAKSQNLLANAEKKADRHVKETLKNIRTLSPTQPKVSESVTSVSQLTDVRSTDWTFTALQSLVERYGCIAGYPDRTFRGRQAISRYEFAAGINACLDKINEIIATGLADKVSKEDLATVQKLQEEFAAELATLRGRVDKLEARTVKLEAQQFSTTTKLYGQAIFGLQGRLGNTADIFPRDGIRNAFESDQGTNLTFGYNFGLSLLTQFDSLNRSILLVSLSSSNLSLNSGISSLRDSYTLLGYEGTTNNQIQLSDLSYRFSLTSGKPRTLSVYKDE